LDSLLCAGLGYVCQDSMLLGLFGCRRAFAVLQSEICGERFPTVPAARDKETRRVLRNVLKGRRVELRINSDMEQCLKLLQNHHGSRNWVNQDLADLWRWMAQRDQFVVFELWVDDELLAADFGHYYLSGRCFYVSTRCYSSAHRRYQPGFVLAALSTDYLRSAGVLVWDLGDFDGSAAMSYKRSLTPIQSRLTLDRVLRLVRCNYMGGS
jgi:hypothetical protein